RSHRLAELPPKRNACFRGRENRRADQPEMLVTIRASGAPPGSLLTDGVNVDSSHNGQHSAGTAVVGHQVLRLVDPSRKTLERRRVVEAAELLRGASGHERLRFIQSCKPAGLEGWQVRLLDEV